MFPLSLPSGASYATTAERERPLAAPIHRLLRALTNTIVTNTDNGGSTILPTWHAQLPDNGSHSFSSRIGPPPLSTSRVWLDVKKRPGAPIESIPRLSLADLINTHGRTRVSNALDPPPGLSPAQEMDPPPPSRGVGAVRKC